LFVACNEKGIHVNVAEKKWSREGLKRMREHSNFFCPVCSNEVELKVGSVITAHFAHKRLSDCTASNSESESQYHMKGKLDLFEWLQIQPHLKDVRLEPYLGEIKQRPDILFRDGDARIPLEFQCSKIDSKTFRKRSVSYLELQMDVFWILGAKTLKRAGSRSFLISPFQWLFAEIPGKGEPPRIYSYCTESKSFIVLFTIIPFSPKLIFTFPQKYSLNPLTYHELKRKKISEQNVYSAWFDHIRKFRLKSSNYLTRDSAYLNMYLYKTKQLPLSYLSSFALLPLKTTYLIESPVYVWQGWILVYIDRIQLHQSFTFQDICHYIGRKVVEKLIKIRRLPQINLHYSYVIKEYLIQLCHFSILKSSQKNIFIKNNTIQWLTNMENLLKADEEMKRSFITINGDR
jgi:competence protein CoiA